jgi:hypothetical protein
LSFYFLLKAKPSKGDLSSLYAKCLKLVIAQGGNVALNSSIVLGMVGALIGVKRIPRNMVQKLLSFDCTNEDSAHVV